MTHRTIKPKLILYAEDQKELATMINCFLKREEILMEHAPNYKTAIQAFAGKEPYSGIDKYEALLLDQNLGDGLGSDLAHTARNMGFKYPIVMFSGADLEDAIEKTKHLENVSHFQKPTREIKTLIHHLYRKA